MHRTYFTAIYKKWKTIPILPNKKTNVTNRRNYIQEFEEFQQVCKIVLPGVARHLYRNDQIGSIQGGHSGVPRAQPNRNLEFDPFFGGLFLIIGLIVPVVGLFFIIFMIANVIMEKKKDECSVH